MDKLTQAEKDAVPDTVSYEEALKQSEAYFGGDEIAAKVYLDKYAIKIGNRVFEATPASMHWRIAREFARVEANKFKNPLGMLEIFDLLDKFKYIIPQGSPMFGIGNPFQTVSLSNCYVVSSPEDSYGGIFRTDEELAQISKRRGGTGGDISNLRPSGAPTKNAAVSSTGMVSFMHRYSNTIREVAQNGRRGALMLTASVHHPDIAKFVTVKNDEKSVTGANISVRLTDEFMNAVVKDTDVELRWPVDAKNPSIKTHTPARDLWKTIIHSAWLRAEPGLLFWDNIIEGSLADCYKDVGFGTVSTNPCSEIPLCPYDSCRLLVINPFSFVVNPFTKDAYFDYKKFSEVGQVAQRLMDDLIDLELENLDKILAKIIADPERDELKQVEYDLWTKIRDKCVRGRRTGTGMTSLGDTLAALGLSYGSDASIKVIEKITKTLKLAAVRSSMEMAKELGAFPEWSWKKEKDHPFLLQIAKEDPELYANLAKHGRRNIAWLTIAPTGSVSILTQTTSGIEPLFMLEPYTRRKKVNPNDKNARIDFTDPNGDTWQNFEVYHPRVKQWMEITGETDVKKSPWYKCCAEDIDWSARVRLQAAAQKHIDHAISSTVNLPENVTEDKVAEIYETAWKAGCKGITVYRKNCRTGVLIEKDAPKADAIVKTQAPKRPDSLRAEVHHPVIKGQNYYVVVGLYGIDPYEVFTGVNDDKKKELFIPKADKHGKVIKRGRKNYYFVSESGEEYLLTNGHADDSADALARMISTGLRHGSDINFIVHQLEKTNGDLMSFSKVLARTLKKYIQDGSVVSGEECPTCKNKHLKRQEGCATCLNCGWSKCS